MSDIVERLRLRASGGPTQGQLDDEAADEIERLRHIDYEEIARVAKLEAEIERLRSLIHPFEGAMAKVEEQGDEIDRLRHNEAFHVERAAAQDVEIERLKAVLRELMAYRLGIDPGAEWDAKCRVARAALERKT